MYQATIRRSVEFEGIGLHTGQFCRLRLHPEDNKGIRFIIRGEYIPANYRYVVNTKNSTDLGKGSVGIKTVEHLMAVLYMLGIDNLVIEVLEGCEVPAMDGSGYLFYKRLKGLVQKLDKEKEFIQIKDPLVIRNCTAKIEALPSDHFSAEYVGSIEGLLKDHRAKYKGNAKGLVFARTFCYDYQVEALRKAGLAKGGSLKNAVVLGKNGNVYNTEGLRCKDEPIRHKLLDLIGDLSLLGKGIKGRIVSYHGGHSLNYEFVKSLAGL
ncbi:UDP-3-O-acyl-N-acetylglucosamine deacetylase [Thermocrinis sp.]